MNYRRNMKDCDCERNYNQSYGCQERYEEDCNMTGWNYYPENSSFSNTTKFDNTQRINDFETTQNADYNNRTSSNNNFSHNAFAKCENYYDDDCDCAKDFDHSKDYQRHERTCQRQCRPFICFPQFPCLNRNCFNRCSNNRPCPKHDCREERRENCPCNDLDRKPTCNHANKFYFSGCIEFKNTKNW